MEAFLVALNKILDIKLVQYILVAILLALSGYSTYLVFKNKTISLISQQRKVALQEVENNMFLQNQKIIEQNKELDARKVKLEAAQQIASKIALESNKTLQGILGYTFTGDCEDQVEQTLSLIRSK